MAIEANTQLTYDAIGNREDLTNDIWNVDPTDTPFANGMTKIKATARSHEWQTQALASASTGNAQIEGDEFSAEAVTPTARLNNRCQILKKTFVISGTQEAVDSAGRESDIAYQTTLKMAELKRDLEAILMTNQAQVTGDATTASKMSSVLSFLKSNTVFESGNSGADPVTSGTTARTDDGTPVPFAEEDLVSECQLTYTSSGKNGDKLFVNAFQKLAVDGFTGKATAVEDAEKKKITNNVKIYDGPFGMFAVVPDLFMRTSDALHLRHELWKLAELRPTFRKDIPPNGDHERFLVLWEGTLEACNEKGSGGIFDLTSS